VGGPRGSFVISPAGIDLHLLIGDETALPAIGRRLEELPAASKALVVVEAEEGAANYPLKSTADLRVVRVLRAAKSAAPEEQLIGALRGLEFPTVRCYAWAAAETHVARSIRRYLTSERGFDKRWIKAAGYWRQGATGIHDSIGDED
jgi:NADPH-dependent ferric siderophore reductase